MLAGFHLWELIDDNLVHLWEWMEDDLVKMLAGFHL